MKIIKCSLARHTAVCDIYIGQSITEQIGKVLDIKSTGVCIVADANLQKIAGKIANIARKKIKNVHQITLVGGEEVKCLETVSQIYSQLLGYSFDRRCVLIAVGGGTITDTVGFVAATYMRGVEYIAVPTTLLGQVDAGIGGKTGVNFAGAKNIIGAFHQPKAIIVDTDALRSLPTRQLSTGMAEIIKYALIMDTTLWSSLGKYNLNSIHESQLTNWITRCIKHKIAIVTQDEHDEGLRATLNFGHTAGHAIEKVSKQYNHGEAVAIGMVAATALSTNVLGVSTSVVPELKKVLKKYNLPIACPGLDRDKLIQAMKHDKKIKNGSVKWVLLDKVGHAVYDQSVDITTVKRIISNVCN